MPGQSPKEYVKSVIILGVATADMDGTKSIYFDHEYTAIPDNDDWSSVPIKKLRVKPAVTMRNQANDPRLHFNVNIPSFFFSPQWKFLAKPAYKKGDGIKAKMTGHGETLAFIDINVDGRGRGGNTEAGEVGGEGCAKWS
tara:strand:- start:1967 stop:2386 length:420 start_codon:yes stop_codon:yes gene_type:complete